MSGGADGVSALQAVITTYCLLTFIAVESIVVYRIETWQEHKVKKAALLAARQQRLAQRRAAADAAAADGGEEREAHLQPQHPLADDGEANGLHCAVGVGPPDAPCAGLAEDGKLSQASMQAHGTVRQGKQRGSPLLRCFGLHQRRASATRCSSPEAEASYHAWLAYCTDRCSFAVGSVCYVVSIVLIYTLNSGYIDLFPNLPPWEL